MRIKRFLGLIAALVIALAVAGCGDDDKTADKAGATGPTATPSVTEPGATGDEGADDKKDDSDDKKSDNGDKSDDDSKDSTDDTDDSPDDTDDSPDDNADKDDSVDNTLRPPTGIQFLVNDHRFVGATLEEGPFKGKFGREVPPNSTIIVRTGVFDRATVMVRVKGPDSNTRTYNARKIPRLRPLSLGQSYQLKVVGTGSTAYIYATKQPHLTGPAG